MSVSPQASSAAWYSLTCARCGTPQRVEFEHCQAQFQQHKPMRCLLCLSKGVSGVLIPGPSQTEPERN